MESDSITSWQIDGKGADFIILDPKITVDSDCSHKIKRHLLLERKAMTVLDSISKVETSLCHKGLCSQSCGFSSSHVEIWELDHKEGWVPKNWYFWSVVVEKTLESPLDFKEIKTVNPKDINPKYSLERLMLKLKLQYFSHLIWRADSLIPSIGKDTDVGKDWGQEEKKVIEDEMTEWHYRLSGHEFEQTLGDGEGQGRLGCCSPGGHRVRHDLATEKDIW